MEELITTQIEKAVKEHIAPLYPTIARFILRELDNGDYTEWSREKQCFIVAKPQRLVDLYNEVLKLAEEKAPIPMSEYPDQSSLNLLWDDDWKESNRICPQCKDVKMWRTGWYDDSPEAGGACIGTTYRCGKCNHYEDE